MSEGGGRVPSMKTCPICGTKAYVAARRCKAECGWNFSEKVLEKGDGGNAVRQAQERKRKLPDPPLVSKLQGTVTTHEGIDPEDDGNMDSCVICGDIGTLICCDICPLSFHPDCAGLSVVPSGFWCCPQCSRKNLQASGAAVNTAAGGAASNSATAAGSAGASANGGAGGATAGIAAGGKTTSAGNAADAAAAAASVANAQSGLDAFHQKLNSSLDYNDTQSVEHDGITFMCFKSPHVKSEEEASP